MIDMTFQLIAFFMVLINFTEADQNQQIRLPSSELAKPTDAPPIAQITVQLTRKESVIMAGEEINFDKLKKFLIRERQVLEAGGKYEAANATVIIRADRRAKAGRVQEIIKMCQDTGFEKFVLRAKQQESI